MKESVFPSFSPAEYERRYRNIRELMDAHGVSALVIHGGVNSGETAAKQMRDIGLVGSMPYDQNLPMTKILPEVKFHNLTRPYRLLRSDKSDEEVVRMRPGETSPATSQIGYNEPQRII